MSRSIYNIIKSEYDRKQQNALSELVHKRNEAYAIIPGLEDIENRIQLSGVKYNKMILFGNSPIDEAVKNLHEELSYLKSEKKKLLVEFGYMPDYLTMVYTCPKCKDTGYIENGSGAKRCTCYKQQLLDLLYSQSNLKLAEKENFSSFDETLYPDVIDHSKYNINISPRDNIRSVKERCLKFIENFDSSDEKNLFFSGSTGVGKTFMSNCIAMELLNKGKTVLYQTAPVLFNIISEHKQKSFKEDEYEDASYKLIFDADLLIIDDLGTESQNASRFAELLNILNTRHANNLTRPCKIIISTNVSPKMLHEYYSERVMSRIVGCFDRLMFAGEDIRLIKASAST